MIEYCNLFNFYFICVLWINFCNCFTFYMTTITTTSYAMDVLGVNSAMAGFASGIFVIGIMCVRLAVGKNLDKINLKKWLIIRLFVLCV